MPALTDRQKEIIKTIADVYENRVSEDISFLIAQLMENNERNLNAIKALINALKNTNDYGNKSWAALEALKQAETIVGQGDGM
jgi:hypothetical protein